jgi:hypothetical protein
MRFAMFIVSDPDHSAQDVANGPGFDDWHPYAIERGAYVEGIRFHDPDAGRVVRVRDGQQIVTQGNFTDSVEKILGLSIIECDSWDEAIDLAVHNNMAHEGRIELREIHSMGGPE